MVQTVLSRQTSTTPEPATKIQDCLGRLLAASQRPNQALYQRALTLVLRSELDEATLVRLAQLLDGSKVYVKDLVIDLYQKEVTRNGQRIHLSDIEWRVLLVLAKAKGETVAPTRIIDEVWGNATGRKRDHYIRLYVRYLRGKLGGDRYQYILNTWGRGYRLNV